MPGCKAVMRAACVRVACVLAGLVTGLGAVVPGAVMADVPGASAAGASSPSASPPSVKLGQLTVETALAMAKAALLACRAKGYQVAVTVVDRDGTAQVSLRDTLAAPLAGLISFDKAYTSAMFDSKTSVLATEPQFKALARADGHLAFAAGAVPVQAGGMYFGAIGVSGTPSGQTDEDCAAAGLAVVQDDLDMQ